MLSKEELAGMIDYSLLKAEATREDIKQLCLEAMEHQLHSVCINPCYIREAKELLEGSGVRIATVVGYPLGATLPEVKAFEASRYVDIGADELDMVMNIGAFKSGDYKLVEEDIRGVVAAARKIVKVIIETGLLTDEEIAGASEIVKRSGADFVKSGTGWDKNATPRDIAIIRKAVGPGFGVKAAGGIISLEQAVKLIDAGANRIGTSSAVRILKQI